jgi:hypothetical protein
MQRDELLDRLDGTRRDRLRVGCGLAAEAPDLRVAAQQAVERLERRPGVVDADQSAGVESGEVFLDDRADPMATGGGQFLGEGVADAAVTARRADADRRS